MKLQEILSLFDIRSFGVCDFSPSLIRLPCRRTHEIPAQAKSIIVCAFPYYTGEHPHATVCRYAIVPDYHAVCGTILNSSCNLLQQEFGGSFVWFCDISPFSETRLAVQAGLGVRGQNNLIIHPTYGSYFVIGEIITDQPFPASEAHMGSCMGCGACLKQCPQNCIKSDGVDYSQCLSALTQQKGILTPAQQTAIQQGGLAWGCDRCQECCPHNRNLPHTHIPAFLSDMQPIVHRRNVASLLKTRAFGYRGEKVLQRNLDLLKSERL